MELQPGRAPLILEDDFKPLRTPKSPSNPMMMHDVANSMQQMHLQPKLGVSLSPFAKEFVPQNYNTLGIGGAIGVGSSGSGEQHQYQPPRYTNGYNQQNQYEQVHQEQQEQHQMYYQQSQQEQMHMFPMVQSVQDRLTYYQQNQNHQQQSSNQHQQQQFQQQQFQQHHQHHHNQQHQQQQKYHQQQQHQLNFQNQHNSNKYSRHTQQQRLHQQQHGHSNADRSHHNQKSSNSSVEQIALEYLKKVMDCLDQNPGQFDTVAPRFINIYEGMENNQYVLANAMEDIFEQSVSNPNFRYMGAKLYNLLHMLNPTPDSLFHDLLKCKLKFQQSQIVEYLRDHQSKKVRETALFLAELYMQLRCGGDETQRIQLIAENIIYSLKQLLDATMMEETAKEIADNVRCICLTLKLAGYDLTKDCSVDMSQIIAQLEQIEAQSPGKYPLATNVINLQKNNWGRKPSSSSSISEPNGASGEPSCPVEPLRASDEPIFYGPDGRELTHEESEFLSSGVAPESSTDDEYGVGADLDIEYDLEMDEETEKAYIEFCKQNASK